MELKVPPQNIEAEQGILASIFINPSYAVPIAMEKLNETDFYREANLEIYKAIIAVREKLIETKEIMPVIEYLKVNNLLEKVGGAEYLTNLLEATSTSTSIRYYIELVTETAKKRKYLEMAYQISEGIENSTSEDLFGLIKTNLDLIGLDREIPIISMQDGLKETFKELERINESDGMIGVPSGFIDIDNYTNGWQAGDLIVIAGRPGMGKSVFVKDSAESAGVPILYFPIEMSVTQTQRRQISGVSMVDFSKLQSGRLQDDDWTRIVSAIGELGEIPIYYVDKGELTIEEIIAISHTAYRKYNIGLVIVDYLQLIIQKHRNKDGREQEVANISRQLKGLARDLKIPVIVVSQLNRDCEKRQNKKPQLSDLRESGAIEQDADVVIFLFRPAYYFSNAEKGEAQVILAKGRNIRTGMIKLFFDGEHQSFKDSTVGEYDGPH